MRDESNIKHHCVAQLVIMDSYKKNNTLYSHLSSNKLTLRKLKPFFLEH